ERSGTGAADIELGVAGGFEQADRFAHGFGFLADARESFRASESGRLCRGLSFAREPQRIFPAIERAESGASLAERAIGRRGLERPRGRQFFVRAGDGEAPAVILRRL